MRRWRLRPAGAPATGARLDALALRILAARGFSTIDAAEDFCNPKLTGLHDPSLIPDLDRAAERILRAARDGESIVIWGDYDVDGVTAAAILYRTLRAISPGVNVRVHIPHRIDDGYGLNAEGVREVTAAGATLIVTVDCGVTATESAKIAKECGADLIITDHHTAPARIEDLPEAYAVAHPGRPDSAYPYSALCGAGVAYKLAWRLTTLAAGSERVGEPIRQLLIDLLAYVALGTIADVVPLLDENRAIARFGLSRIKATPFVGLRALIEASGLAGERIRSEDVGFRLAPRLNACGRMGHAREALELLITESPVRAAEIAHALTCLNDERRATERRIAEQAIELAEAAGMTHDNHRAIVLAHEQWHAGVIGIVCSRLVDRFARPTILLQRNNCHCAGSCRSIEGFDIHAALARCAAHLETFGGHTMAAGLRLRSEKLDRFVEAFVECANERISVEQLTPSLLIDCECSLDELTPQAVQQVERFGPFGQGNPHPSLLVRGVEVERAPQPLGAEGRHLAIHVRQRDRLMKLLAWNWGERRSDLHAGARLDVVIEPKLNTWRGVVSVEPHVRDLGPAH